MGVGHLCDIESTSGLRDWPLFRDRCTVYRVKTNLWILSTEVSSKECNNLSTNSGYDVENSMKIHVSNQKQKEKKGGDDRLWSNCTMENMYQQELFDSVRIEVKDQ